LPDTYRRRYNPRQVERDRAGENGTPWAAGSGVAAVKRAGVSEWDEPLPCQTSPESASGRFPARALAGLPAGPVTPPAGGRGLRLPPRHRPDRLLHRLPTMSRLLPRRQGAARPRRTGLPAGAVALGAVCAGVALRPRGAVLPGTLLPGGRRPDRG